MEKPLIDFHFGDGIKLKFIFAKIQQIFTK